MVAAIFFFRKKKSYFFSEHAGELRVINYNCVTYVQIINEKQDN